MILCIFNISLLYFNHLFDLKRIYYCRKIKRDILLHSKCYHMGKVNPNVNVFEPQNTNTFDIFKTSRKIYLSVSNSKISFIYM